MATRRKLPPALRQFLQLPTAPKLERIVLESIVQPAIVLVINYKSMEAREDFYPLIGKVVVRFQDADMFLNLFMMCLLNENINVTRAFMVTLPFSKKLASVLGCPATRAGTPG